MATQATPWRPASEEDGSLHSEDAGAGDGPARYYLKAIQRDGEMAWSNPIWIG